MSCYVIAGVVIIIIFLVIDKIIAVKHLKKLPIAECYCKDCINWSPLESEGSVEGVSCVGYCSDAGTYTQYDGFCKGASKRSGSKKKMTLEI